MERKGLLLDTSFLIRLLNDQDSFHQHALEYYRYFLEHQHVLFVSTVSVAEYLVKGEFDELPVQDIRFLPFNVDHARKAGKFAGIVFSKKDSLTLPDRKIIPNDTKLFAQTDIEKQIESFVTADVECIKVYNSIKETNPVDFTIINIRTPLSTYLGTLPFPP